MFPAESDGHPLGRFLPAGMGLCAVGYVEVLRNRIFGHDRGVRVVVGNRPTHLGSELRREKEMAVAYHIRSVPVSMQYHPLHDRGYGVTVFFSNSIG